MKETLKMMKSILTGKESKANEKEIIEEYKKDLCPNILAYFYSDNFGIIYKTSELYSLLSSEDKASFCLQELDKCLQNYNVNSNAKFITYFIKCYKNRLRVESQLLLYDKRKSIIQYRELDNISEVADLNIEDINLLLRDYNLTESETLQVKLLNYGYKIREIAKLLNITSSAVSQRNQIIKQKILSLT
jgi:hypothetical protein